MKNQKINSFLIFNILVIFFYFFNAIIAKANDDYFTEVPIERDFLKLPQGKWIWLKKTGWDTTKIMIGHNSKKDKNALWTKIHNTTDSRSWAYAYFVALKPNKFAVDLNGDGLLEVAISTYEYGNNMIREIMIFTIEKNNKLKFLKNYGPYNIAADEPIYQ